MNEAGVGYLPPDLARRRHSGSVCRVEHDLGAADAGAKEEIYGVLRSIAAQGVGVLLVSDDLAEIIDLSNRILVMRGGTIA
jgi:ABC-type nitrate/sulfonate/bicarbonate transport system ATPase subunit